MTIPGIIDASDNDILLTTDWKKKPSNSCRFCIVHTTTGM
jgi:hypothetical protein